MLFHIPRDVGHGVEVFDLFVGDLDAELNKWISQYVTEMDNPDAVTRSKRPLRMAKIVVNDVAGDPGWYSVDIFARPHFKYMGSNFTLSLVGKLDKS